MLNFPLPVLRPLQLIMLGTLVCACSGAEDGSGGAGSGRSTSGDVSGRFAAVYEVPTSPELAAAAQYPVDSVSWSAAGDVASLVYDLPKELLGKTVDLAFTGTIDTTGEAALAGESGSATCQRQAQHIVCKEQLSSSVSLEPDLKVVEQLAAKSYAGNAQDRVDVARLFSNDPIGIITIDLDAPRPED